VSRVLFRRLGGGVLLLGDCVFFFVLVVVSVCMGGEVLRFISWLFCVLMEVFDGRVVSNRGIFICGLDQCGFVVGVEWEMSFDYGDGGCALCVAGVKKVVPPSGPSCCLSVSNTENFSLGIAVLKYTATKGIGRDLAPLRGG